MKRLLKSELRMIRVEKILSSLEMLDFATREQLQVIHQLGSARNAQRLLAEIENDGFIQCVRMEKKVYYLTAKGRDKIGSTKEIKRNNGQLEHTLMRNDVYIHVGQPVSWRIEEPVNFKIKKQNGSKIELVPVKIVPDATYETDDTIYFIEVDHTQNMKENRDKINRYAELQPKLHYSKSKKMEIIFYTLTESRKEKIEKLCQEKGVTITSLTRGDL